MRVLFSIYQHPEAYNDLHPTLVYSKWVCTYLEPLEIERYLSLPEGYDYHITSGTKLTFWDVNCFFGEDRELISRIENLPLGNPQIKKQREPKVLRVVDYSPEVSSEEDFERMTHSYFYQCVWVERGVKGFSAIAYWMAAHPLELSFICSIVYDLIKGLLRRIIRKWREKDQVTRPIILNVKRFYKNFSRSAHIKEDCQITSFNRLKSGQYAVSVRTFSNERYETRCLSNGKILRLKKTCD